MKKPPIKEASSLASRGDMQYICSCSHHGQILSLHNTSVQEQRNPQRVSEAVQESSARINVIVPGHPDRLPEAERITPIIYVGGGQAELNSFPLREIARFVQGIVLFKESTLYLGFSCN